MLSPIYSDPRVEIVNGRRIRGRELALIETDSAAKTGLPVSVITSFRDKFVVIRAAPRRKGFQKLEESPLREIRGIQRRTEINSAE